MKKYLLSLAALASVSTAFAQVEVGAIDMQAVSDTYNNGTLFSDNASTTEILPTGAVLATSNNVTMTYFNAEPVKASACKVLYEQVKIGGVTLDVSSNTTGLQGAQNGGKSDKTKYDDKLTYTDIVNAGETAAATWGRGGCQFAFSIAANKDDAGELAGYLYVAGKMTSNKNYFVGRYEGTTYAELAEASADVVGYVAGMLPLNTKGDETSGTTLENYTLVSGVSDLESGVYDALSAINTPEQMSVAQGGGKTEAASDGLGVIAFPVLKGYTYVVCATGSKMTCGGYMFTAAAADVTLYTPAKEASEDGATPASEAKESEVIIKADQLAAFTGNATGVPAKEIGGSTPTAITTPIADIVNGGAAYNIAGQRVNNNAKGLVIKNGKKYLVK